MLAVPSGTIVLGGHLRPRAEPRGYTRLSLTGYGGFSFCTIYKTCQQFGAFPVSDSVGAHLAMDKT